MNPAQKALWYIESHLAEPLTLDDVACVAGVSRFHLVRAFASATGFSVMRYVRARRLTKAAQALAAGEPVPIRATSIARTLGAPFATQRTMAAARQFLEDIAIVPDVDAVRELLWVLQNERVLVEPAAACVVAAALAKKQAFQPGERVCLVLCGSNVAMGDIESWRKNFAL